MGHRVSHMRGTVRRHSRALLSLPLSLRAHILMLLLDLAQLFEAQVADVHATAAIGRHGG